MKKQHLLLSILTLVSLSVLGQNSKSIEVVISDTIQIEGTEFNYTFFVINDELPYMIQQDFGTNNDFKTISDQELMKLAEKEGVDIIQDNKIPFQISPQDIQEQMVNMKFYSKNDLVRFIGKLEEYKNIQGLLTSVGIGNDTTEHEELIDKKLIRKGKEKAKRLASYFGKNLGEILEISEDISASNERGMNTYNFNNTMGWTSYPPSYNSIGELGLQGTDTYLVFYKSMKFKFELK